MKPAICSSTEAVSGAL